MNSAKFKQYIFHLEQWVLPLCIVLVSIFSISNYIENSSLLANTSLWISVQIFVLLIFFISKKYYFDNNQTSIMFFVKFYLLWNMLNISRGVFIAENYWDWKNLVVHSLALLLPIMAYVATNKMVMQLIFKSYLIYALPLFFVLLYFINDADAYGFYLVPISLLIIFFPLIDLRWKLITLVLAVFVITVDLGARSNVIKFAIPLLLSLIYYFRQLISTQFLNKVRMLILVSPLILFTLALSGSFNIFNMDDYINTEITTIKQNAEGEIMVDDLKSDTRSFLYEEVLGTAEKYNNWLIGRSPARGNESDAFGAFDEAGRGERSANEVAILNVFTWTGIVGVILYFMVFYRASDLAINYSNNTFSQILGIFVAFRWLYAWVEDVNTFTLTYVFLWFLIGICYSKSFRDMSNKEVGQWVKGIFNKKIIIK